MSPHQEARPGEAPGRKMAHTGLLEGPTLVLFMKSAIGGKENECTKCYHPLYDGENLGSLIRVCTNIDPKCFNGSQLTTCRECEKVCWIAENTATFRQNLLGACPAGESWFCFEHKHNLEGSKDVVKEKQLTVTTTKYELEFPTGKIYS